MTSTLNAKLKSLFPSLWLTFLSQLKSKERSSPIVLMEVAPTHLLKLKLLMFCNSSPEHPTQLTSSASEESL